MDSPKEASYHSKMVNNADVAARGSSGSFSIKYGGPALDNHEMDIRDLAPSLLGLADLFDRAQSFQNSLAPAVILKFRTSGEGSVLIDMMISHANSAATTGLDIFTGRPITALINVYVLKTIVWDSIRSKLDLRGLRNSSDEISRGHDEGRGFDTNTREMIAEVVAELLQDPGYHQSLKSVVKPLSSDGIIELQLKDDGSEIVIKKEDIDLLGILNNENDADLGETTYETNLEVLGAEFDGRKWRFTEGRTKFWAAIHDIDFVNKIENHEVTFGRGDILRVMLKVHQYRNSLGRLKAEYTIVKVYRHYPSASQSQLDL